MLHLLKLSQAILNATDMETVMSPVPIPTSTSGRASDSSNPLQEEQDSHENSVAFGDKIDFSLEPSTEYLD